MNPLRHIPKKRLRGELLMRGFTLSSWARARGYPVVSTQMIVQRHCGTEDTMPRGEQTMEIAWKLAEEIQTPIEPIHFPNSEHAA